MTECKLVAEAEGVGDVRDGLMRVGKEQLGLLDPESFQIVGEGDSHLSVKDIGTIFFRVSKEDCELLEGELPMKIRHHEPLNLGS